MSPFGADLDTLNLLQAGVLVLEADGQIKQANTEATLILGRSVETLLSQPIDAVLASIRDVVAVAKDHSRGQACLETPEGPRYIGYTARYGTVQAPIIVMFRDISSIARLRQERDRLLRMATVGEVLPTVLHELRNPLAAVISAVEVLLEDVVAGFEPDALQPTLHSVLHELRRMGLIFHGIGIVGRKLRSSSHAAVDLAVEEAVRIMTARAERDGITLELCHCPLPLLPFDASVVRAVVFNLINNALQACESGDSIKVCACLRAGAFFLEISDTGKGMSPEVLDQCTRAFFSTRHNGSGLGLVICREATEEAGGSFTIESRLGAGTTVSVVVPLERSMESD
jgi:signal transduction histidine kinase